MSLPDLILIGRNEGARLHRCLISAQGKARRMVYVDSGSDDYSVVLAAENGAEIVRLSDDAPFTAARARHEGFEYLEATGGVAEFVQFIDGDCEIDQDWIATAQRAISEQTTWGMVTGWRSEMFPQKSLYNALCHVEWRRPAGQILACGGDMMVRAEAYRQAGGFDARVIAAEDDEFCCRLRKAGWHLERLPHEMTRHDADMSRFGQWWKRAERTGHGFEQVNDLHPEYFRRERLRMWFFGAILPLLFLCGLLLFWPLSILVLLAYGLSYWRTVRGLEAAEKLPRDEALRHSVLLSLSKIPNVLGALRYRLRKQRGADMVLIEYK